MDRILTQFKRRAAKALPGRIAKVVLFGSRARGDAEPDSDWDVAVFLSGPPPKTQDRFALADAAYDLIVESDDFLQPLAFPLARWSEDSALMRAIRKDGVEV